MPYGALTALLITTMGATPPVHAHGFGQRFDLPLPLDLYVAAGVATVLLSFALMALFYSSSRRQAAFPHLDLLRVPGLRALGRPGVVVFLRTISVAWLGLTVAAGLLGNSDPYRNIAPTTVWIVFWVGLAYVSALGANLWTLINPWRVVYDALESLHASLRPSRGFGLRRRYPAWLGVWPATLLFLVFAWLELASSMAEVPSILGHVVVVYSLVTWTGMFVFGADRWLRRGEAFSVVFRLFAGFAPTVIRLRRRQLPAARRCAWMLRPPAVGLLSLRAAHVSMVVFTILVVAAVTFDGFADTSAWKLIVNRLTSWAVLHPLFAVLWRVNVYDVVAITSLGLVAFAVLFLGLYLLCARMIVRAAGGVGSTRDIALRFVMSLVPIAIGYHLAHYLSLLLISGQLLIPLASDPFGFGWDLFGTAAHQIDFLLIGPRTLWYVSITAIVSGHVLAVYVAHVLAIRTYGSARVAVTSQIPMLVLMIAYTSFSLWIVAQPLAH